MAIRIIMCLLAACLFGMLLVGCATQPRETYADQLAGMPMPTDAAGTQQQCAWVRSEITRMHNIQTFAPQGPNPYMAMAMKAQTNNNIADLESRAADMHCAAAFSNQPVPTRDNAIPPANAIGQCVAACKANTSRTGAQCFDDCNHK